jgi:hypothetical protein
VYAFCILPECKLPRNREPGAQCSGLATLATKFGFQVALLTTQVFSRAKTLFTRKALTKSSRGELFIKSTINSMVKIFERKEKLINIQKVRIISPHSNKIHLTILKYQI